MKTAAAVEKRGSEMAAHRQTRLFTRTARTARTAGVLPALIVTVALAVAVALVTGCAATRPSPAAHAAPAGSGRLIAIGGAIRPENAAVFERFFELATPEQSLGPGPFRSSHSAPRSSPAATESGPPRILIATAASGNEPAAAASTEKTLRRYAASAVIETIGRDTPPADAVALIDRAAAIYFTGGDQARITAKYRPGGVDGPEAAAMRRLLARGGVIAGTSAGDAMMSDPMFLGGRSPEALGVARPRGPAASRRPSTTDQPETTGPPSATDHARASQSAPATQDQSASQDAPAAQDTPAERQPSATDDSAAAPRNPPPLGPRLGPGMALVPWAIMDSHFFERDRFGRLVAALEADGTRLGLGVGEDAAIEIDLAAGEAVALTDAPTLLVDIGATRRDGLARIGIRTRLLTRRGGVSFNQTFKASPPEHVAAGTSGLRDFAPEAGPSKQSAARQFFEAVENSATPLRLRLDGYDLIGRAWEYGAIVDIVPAEANP